MCGGGALTRCGAAVEGVASVRVRRTRHKSSREEDGGGDGRNPAAARSTEARSLSVERCRHPGILTPPGRDRGVGA